MPSPQDPTARSIALASWLRELRGGTGLTTTEVGNAVGWNQSKVSRVETGISGIGLADLEKLLDLYGTDSGARALLMQLARDADRRGWWTTYGDIWGDNPYLALEDMAVTIREWQAQVVPGLLQTPGYAHAVIAAANANADPALIEQMVRARLARKPVLERANAPRICAIIDEAAFRRGMVDPRIMVPQVRALLDTPDHVQVRVLPYTVGWHAGMDSSMVILSFGPGLMDKPYVAGAGGALYIESTNGIAHCQEVWSALDGSALSRKESRAWLSALLKE